jgi:hypothetical protein
METPDDRGQLGLGRIAVSMARRHSHTRSAQRAERHGMACSPRAKRHEVATRWPTTSTSSESRGA